MPNDNSREFDVIVWGATGFTGRLVAEYLFRRHGVGGDLRWAIGGRSAGKLAAIREGLGEGAEGLDTVTGDSGDPGSMRELAARSQVICTTVGPYARYGSDLVAACAAGGTDYCDLSGEVPWMRRMIDAHEDAARESGARIVHSCGFDSIPSDLGVQYLQEQAQARFGEYARHVKYRLKAARGGPSGGTIASLMNVVDEVKADRRVAGVLRNPYGLNPADDASGPDRPDLQGAAWDADLKAWIGPFVMAAINTKVVRRTQALTGHPYGPDFRYDEAVITGRGLGGRLKGVSMGLGMGALMIGAAIRPSRYLLDRFVLAKPGEGPSASERENGFYNIVLLGLMGDGQVIRGRLTGDRDPGYGSTSKMLGEAAVCLARDLDPAVPGGFHTPVSAMGGRLRERLIEHAGLEFRIDE